MGIGIILWQIEKWFPKSLPRILPKKVECKSEQEVFDIWICHVDRWKFGMKFHKFTSHSAAIKEQVDSKKIRNAP